mgnify:CR=1 FL=1
MYLSIRQERKRRQWNQKNVAQNIGITQTMFQKIETGQRKPSFDVLVKLLELFDKKDAVEQIRQLFAPVDDTPVSQPKDNTKK